jgi:hypothetical protein
VVYPSKSSLKVSHNILSCRSSIWYKVALFDRNTLRCSAAVDCELVEVDKIRGLPVRLFICSIGPNGFCCQLEIVVIIEVDLGF